MPAIGTDRPSLHCPTLSVYRVTFSVPNEPVTEIGDPRPVINLRPSGQLVCRCRAAIVILVMWKQFFWTHRVEVAATSP